MSKKDQLKLGKSKNQSADLGPVQAFFYLGPSRGGCRDAQLAAQLDGDLLLDLLLRQLSLVGGAQQVEVGQTLLLEAAALSDGRRLRDDDPGRHRHRAALPHAG